MSQQDAAEVVWPPLETAQSTLVGLITIIAAAAPLGLPPLIVLLAVVTLAQNRDLDWRRTALLQRLAKNPAILPSLALIAFAAISTTWAARPLYSLSSLAQVILTGLAAWYVASLLSRRLTTLGPMRRARFTRAVPISALFIGIYFLLDSVTRDGVTLFFARNFPSLFDGFENVFAYDSNGALVGISEVYFNRSAAALAMLLAGLVAALQFWPRPALGVALGTTATLALIAVCLKSGSTTALLITVASITAFALALWSTKVATRTLQAAFLALTIAMVPLAMVPKMLGIDKNMSLPLSFRERALIWSDLAHLTLERPWFGTGVKSVRFSHTWKREAKENQAHDGTQRIYSHPHNGYLQVWLELGLLGAALFAIAGTLLIGSVERLPKDMQKYALATAAATMVMIGPGWGLWQPWLIAAIGFGWIALMMLRTEFTKVELG